MVFLMVNQLDCPCSLIIVIPYGAEKNPKVSFRNKEMEISKGIKPFLKSN